jgi:hypothetical protein
MKCCTCDAELKNAGYRLPPDWYGKYSGDRLIRLICIKCIKDPAKKAVFTGT